MELSTRNSRDCTQNLQSSLQLCNEGWKERGKCLIHADSDYRSCTAFSRKSAVSGRYSASFAVSHRKLRSGTVRNIPGRIARSNTQFGSAVRRQHHVGWGKKDMFFTSLSKCPLHASCRHLYALTDRWAETSVNGLY